MKLILFILDIKNLVNNYDSNNTLIVSFHYRDIHLITQLTSLIANFRENYISPFFGFLF